MYLDVFCCILAVPNLKYRLTDLIPFLEISHVSEEKIKDVLGSLGCSGMTSSTSGIVEISSILHLDHIPYFI
jgi:hypothetical protein